MVHIHCLTLPVYSAFLCVFRPRVQADRSLKKDSANIVTRVKCDIKDFDPRGVHALWSEKQQALQADASAEAGQPPLSSTSGNRGTEARENSAAGHGKGAASASASPKPWLAVGKHLCGSATDFTIRCCRRHMTSVSGGAPGPEDAAEGPAPLQPACVGLAVATCCHHRCAWKHYVAQDFFTSCGFTPEVNEGSLTLLRPLLLNRALPTLLVCILPWDIPTSMMDGKAMTI